MQILNSSGQDLRVRATGIANLSGIAEMQGSVSGVVSAGGPILFNFTSNGDDPPLHLGFSVARISA
jgi:hypothetical protein